MKILSKDLCKGGGLIDQMTKVNDHMPRPDKKSARFAKFGKYAGIAAFMFFLIKGLAWLVIGGLALWGINS